MEMQEILQSTLDYLNKSEDSIWSVSSVEEMIELMERSIEALQNNQKVNVSELELAFAPTGSLQEIAMENDWSIEFLELSSQFDYIKEKY